MAISRKQLTTLLSMPATSLDPVASETDDMGDHVIERLRFRLSDGAQTQGFLTRPAHTSGPCPAILYAHAHGNRYDIGASELVDGRPALLDAYGPALARLGYITLCIDMPTFGTRAHVTESAAVKAALWQGRTLFGQMLSEQAAALSWLAARQDVDAGRIGMTGISMGATLSYFLAAIDERVAAIAHLCCYADFATLIKTGAHDLHGHYLSIPGLLSATSTGEIAGLVAPRPQLICVGQDDPLTPHSAVAAAFAETRNAYEMAGAANALFLMEEENSGHRETPAIRQATLGFFGEYL